MERKKTQFLYFLQDVESYFASLRSPLWHEIIKFYRFDLREIPNSDSSCSSSVHFHIADKSATYLNLKCTSFSVCIFRIWITKIDLNIPEIGAIRFLSMLYGNVACRSLASGPGRDYCDWIGMVRKLAQIALLARETARGWWEIKTSLNVNCHGDEDTEGGRESTKERGCEEEEGVGVFPSLILMMAHSSPTHIFYFETLLNYFF